MKNSITNQNKGYLVPLVCSLNKWLLQFLIWKENLYSDGQQFLQYQQNEQSPFTLSHWTQTYYDILLDWKVGTGTKYGGVKPINGIPNLPSW